jgi:hypothetical protein
MLSLPSLFFLLIFEITVLGASSWILDYAWSSEAGLL